MVAISRAIAVAQSQPTPIDIGAVGKGKSGKGGKGSKGAGKRNNQTQQACSRCGNTDHTSANCPHSVKTCRKCGNVGHLASVCRSSGTPQPKVKGGQKGKGGGKGANAVKICWSCGESGHMSSQCPKKKVHSVEEPTTASQAGSQDTIMVGLVGSDIDVGSVSEVTLEPRSADEKICSVGAPTVREGESVDIEIDAGAEVSCLLVKIGADTYPPHATRLSQHKIWAVVVGRRSSLQAVEMHTSSGSFGYSHHTLVKMDQRAGVWLVYEGGSSCSSGPAVPEDVEESEPVKKLVVPTAPTATDREEHRASLHAVFRTWCRECCIGRGRKHQHRAGGRDTTIPAIAIDNSYLNERDDLLQEAAGAPIWVSKCNRDRWIGAAIVPTKGADEHAVAELKNDVICSGFTEDFVRSDNEPAILALKESAATALKLTGMSVKMEESALYDSQSNGLAESAVKDVKDAVRTTIGLSRQTFWTRVSRETPQS